MGTSSAANAELCVRKTPSCPVCSAAQTELFMSIDGQGYYRCQRCHATFLEPSQRPTRDREYKHYRTHENDPADPRYRAFLGRLAIPLLKRLPPGLSGLDYGCGPGPALAQMMREAGHTMAVYDPFFAPYPEVLHDTYDFITCTEVVEHFHDPQREFTRLNQLLRPGGLLGLMTMFQTDDARFANWHYRRDPTHVVFYREQTLHTLAADFGWHCEVPAQNVAILTKSNQP